MFCRHAKEHLFWIFKITEYAVDICHYIAVSSKQAKVNIHIRCFFVEVAGAYKSIFLYAFMDRVF